MTLPMANSYTLDVHGTVYRYLFKYNQQEATLYNILYYRQCCTCFRRFLRPTSGVQKLYIQHPVYVKLLAANM